eukprot:jgi/Bigna1/132059/aug1.16_g6767
MSRGVSFVTFPEGKRSADGRLRSFKRGVFKIALARGAKVVPVSIVSSQHIMPKAALLPTVAGDLLRRRTDEKEYQGEPLAVIMHPPIDPEEKKKKNGEDWTNIKRMNEERMNKIDVIIFHQLS